MLEAYGVGRIEGGEGVCELAETAADAVVFCVVGGVLDGVASADGGGVVVGVGFVGGEVDFAEEFLFVVFEFAAVVGLVSGSLGEGRRGSYTMVKGFGRIRDRSKIDR